METQRKLPIPRIQHKGRGGVRKRVKRACEAYRERRTKCDRAKPAYSQCRAQGLDNCFYSESKAARQQAALGSMQREIESYRALLEEVSQGLEGSMADRVAKTLKVCQSSLSER